MFDRNEIKKEILDQKEVRHERIIVLEIAQKISRPF